MHSSIANYSFSHSGLQAIECGLHNDSYSCRSHRSSNFMKTVAQAYHVTKKSWFHKTLVFRISTIHSQRLEISFDPK